MTPGGSPINRQKILFEKTNSTYLNGKVKEETKQKRHTHTQKKRKSEPLKWKCRRLVRRFLAAPDRRLDTCDFQTETGGRAEAQTGKRAVTQEAPRQRTHTHKK